MKALTVSELRSDMKKHLDEVSHSSQIIVVSRAKATDAVVIMSLSEFNALNETSHLLSTVKNRTRLRESLSQIEKGQTITFDPDK